MKTLEFNQMESVQGGSALGCAAGFVTIVGIWGAAVANPVAVMAFAPEAFVATAYAWDLMDKHC